MTTIERTYKDCLSDKMLFDYAEGNLDDESALNCDRHLENCPNCLKRLDLLDHPENDPLFELIHPLREMPNLREHFTEWPHEIEREPFPIKGDSSSPMPQHIGSIRIEKPIGEGGFGKVYLGIDEKLNRKVAVKTIRAEHADRESFLARFESEAKILARLNHPHIPQIFQAGQIEENDLLYFVTEYFEGCNLQEYFDGFFQEGYPEPPDRDGGQVSFDEHDRYEREFEQWESEPPPVFSIAEIRQIMIEVCSTLLAAHRRGILHCDIKPANLFHVIRYSERDDYRVSMPLIGRIKLLDFGIAESVWNSKTETIDRHEDDFGSKIEWSADDATTFQRLRKDQPICGSPGFIAPEIFAGLAGPSVRSDIYSLGATLHFLLTGKSPHAVGTKIVLPYSFPLSSIVELRSDIPDWLVDLHDRMLAENPADRPDSVEKILRVLLAANGTIAQYRHLHDPIDQDWKERDDDREYHDSDDAERNSSSFREESDGETVRLLPPFGCSPESCSGCSGILYTTKDRANLLRFSLGIDEYGILEFSLKTALGEPSHDPNDGLNRQLSAFEFDNLNEESWTTGKSHLDTDRVELRLRPFTISDVAESAFLISKFHPLRIPFDWQVDFVPRPNGKIIFRIESDDQHYRRIELTYHYSGVQFSSGDIADSGPGITKYYLADHFSATSAMQRQTTASALFSPPDSPIGGIIYLPHDPILQNQDWSLSIIHLCGQSSLILKRVELRYREDN